MINDFFEEYNKKSFIFKSIKNIIKIILFLFIFYVIVFFLPKIMSISTNWIYSTVTMIIYILFLSLSIYNFKRKIINSYDIEKHLIKNIIIKQKVYNTKKIEMLMNRIQYLNKPVNLTKYSISGILIPIFVDCYINNTFSNYKQFLNIIIVLILLLIVNIINKLIKIFKKNSLKEYDLLYTILNELLIELEVKKAEKPFNKLIKLLT